MTVEEFWQSTQEVNPPLGLDPMILALWYEAKGDWEKCHAIVQDIDTKDAALIHAYLHRKEGDDWNADFWYTKADAKRPNDSLIHELHLLVERFLK